MVLSFKPLEQMFTGVDSTVTGIRPESSTYVPILLASTLPWIGRSFASAADGQRTAFSLVMNCTPIVLLIMSAGVSMAWSVDDYATLKMTFLVCINVLLAATAVSVAGNIKSMEMYFVAIFILCVWSLAWVFIVPESGIHHATDYFHGTHAGKWRGVFVHKNLLGQAAAMLAVTSVTLSTLPKLLRLLGFGLSIVLLANTESTTSIVTAIVGVSCGFFTANDPNRRMAILVLLLSAIAAAEAAGLSVLSIFSSITGKDTTMSGRLGAWAMAVPEVQRNLPLGLGFGAESNFNASLQNALGPSFVNVHSSYLEVILTLGIWGLAVIVVSVTAILRWSFEPEGTGGGSWRVAYVVGICWLVAGISEVSSFQPNNVYFFAGAMSLLTLSNLKDADRAIPTDNGKGQC